MLIKIVKHSRVRVYLGLVWGRVNLMHFHGACCGGTRSLSFPLSPALCSSIIHSLWHAVKQFHLQLAHCSTVCLAATQDAAQMTVESRWQPFSSATLKHNLHCRRPRAGEELKSVWKEGKSQSFIYTCHLPVEFLIFLLFFRPCSFVFRDWLLHNYPTVFGGTGLSAF